MLGVLWVLACVCVGWFSLGLIRALIEDGYGWHMLYIGGLGLGVLLLQ